MLFGQVCPFIDFRILFSHGIDPLEQGLRKAGIFLAEQLLQGLGDSHLVASVPSGNRRRMHRRRGHTKRLGSSAEAVHSCIHIMSINVAGNAREPGFGQAIGLPIKDHQIDVHFLDLQEAAERIDRNVKRLVLRKSIIARSDQRKGHRTASIGLRLGKGIVIAPAQEHFFLLVSPLPHRSDRMDHVLSIQPKSRCHRSATHSNRANGLPRLQQLRTGLLMDGRIRAAAHNRHGICGIHNGIHLHIGNVISYYGKRHKDSPFHNLSILYIH